MKGTKDLNYYMSLPYTTRIVVCVDSGSAPPYMAQVDELPGCEAQGASEAEALEELADARRLFIETMIEDGVEIPEPTKLVEPLKKYTLIRYEHSHRVVAPQGTWESPVFT